MESPVSEVLKIQRLRTRGETVMAKKQEDKEYREGIKQYNLWMKANKKLEQQGLHGTDYYVRRVEELEAKVKKLEQKLKRRKTR